MVLHKILTYCAQKGDIAIRGGLKKTIVSVFPELNLDINQWGMLFNINMLATLATYRVPWVLVGLIYSNRSALIELYILLYAKQRDINVACLGILVYHNRA